MRVAYLLVVATVSLSGCEKTYEEVRNLGVFRETTYWAVTQVKGDTYVLRVRLCNTATNDCYDEIFDRNDASFGRPQFSYGISLDNKYIAIWSNNSRGALEKHNFNIYGLTDGQSLS